MQKEWKWRRFLTDGGGVEMQNVASANQSGASTNQIGRSEELDVTLDKVSCTSAILKNIIQISVESL